MATESPPALELTEKLIHVNRVSKVLKGGRRFAFSALVVVGNKKGQVGFGKGSALQVASAVKKATESAKSDMIKVPLREGRTLPHDIQGHHGAANVHMRRARPGTGLIAGGVMRSIFECLGLQDVVAKSLGSNNPHSLIRATFKGLSQCESRRMIIQRRSKFSKQNKVETKKPLVTTEKTSEQKVSTLPPSTQQGETTDG